MLEMALANGVEPRCIVFFGAHCDDIEIGCGGTIQQLTKQLPRTQFVFVTLSSNEPRAAESRTAAKLLLADAANQAVEIKQFKDGYFPFIGADIKPYFEDVKARYQPDVIFAHRKDAHQDHCMVNSLTWNTFRDHLIFEYEVVQYDGELSSPNVFVSLTREQLDQKIAVLTQSFTSQLDRQWFTPDTFAALARLRGVECNAPGGFAEAFYCRKLRLNLSAPIP